MEEGNESYQVVSFGVFLRYSGELLEGSRMLAEDFGVINVYPCSIWHPRPDSNRLYMSYNGESNGKENGK